jgi:hypothetical protein
MKSNLRIKQEKEKYIQLIREDIKTIEQNANLLNDEETGELLRNKASIVYALAWVLDNSNLSLKEYMEKNKETIQKEIMRE